MTTYPNQYIENKTFIDIPVGIACFDENIHVKNCVFINCTDEGIVLFYSNNTIENCIFYNCCDGIELQQSSNNLIKNCIFIENNHCGIDALSGCKDNDIKDSIFIENSQSIYDLDESFNVEDCKFISNQEGIGWHEK